MIDDEQKRCWCTSVFKKTTSLVNISLVFKPKRGTHKKEEQDTVSRKKRERERKEDDGEQKSMKEQENLRMSLTLNMPTALVGCEGWPARRHCQPRPTVAPKEVLLAKIETIMVIKRRY